MPGVVATERTAANRLAVLVGLWAGSVALIPNVWAKLALLTPAFLIPICWWIGRRPQTWLLVFLCALIALPPLPIPMGDSGPHPALLLFAFGLFLCSFQLHRWRGRISSTGAALLMFTAVLLTSVLCAALISGFTVALFSLFRAVLFSIGVFVFLYASNGPGISIDGFTFTRFLFRASVVAALFACVDFYFQLPAPAGFGPQFVWLDSGVFRRAQGFFYEASTLGNFCAFFLVMVLVAFRQPQHKRLCSRGELGFGALIFGIALVLSYSRGSVLNVVSAGLAMAALERKKIRKSAALALLCGAVSLSVLYVSFPDFADSYVSRLVRSVQYIWSSPNTVLSGRLNSWAQIGDFVASQPWHLLFGIGYKTLPYSQIAGSSIIADNTYLSLLIETGLVGLAVFVLLNARILRSSLSAARSPSSTQKFFGTWIFCFWIGELVQMTSGDLITYWRLLPLYFWVLAQALAARADRDQLSPETSLSSPRDGLETGPILSC